MKYDKLVRDRIPEIIREDGKTAIVRVASQEEYLAKIKEKLLEETNEFLKSDDPEELADILEVIYAICEHKEISRERIEEMRSLKAEKRGGFSKRLILDETR